MKKTFPSLIGAIGVIFILLGGGVLFFNQAITHPRAAKLPESVAGSGLVLKSEGWRAVDEVQRLHQQDFPLTGGAVGSYGVNRKAILWVAESPFVFLAKRMSFAMRNKIASVNSPFTPSGEFHDGDRIVYKLNGMGQKHYYFQSGKIVVWLAADADTAEQAIQDTLEFYP